MIYRSVLQWKRGERVPLSLYELTFFAVLHFHFMTAFQRRPKRRRVFPFPNNHRRPGRVFFLFLQRFSSLFFILSVYGLAFFCIFLQRFSSLFFLLSVYGLAFFFFYSCNAFPHFFSTFSIRPSIPSLFHCPTSHECRRFGCQNRMKFITGRKTE